MAEKQSAKWLHPAEIFVENLKHTEDEISNAEKK